MLFDVYISYPKQWSRALLPTLTRSILSGSSLREKKGLDIFAAFFLHYWHRPRLVRSCTPAWTNFRAASQYWSSDLEFLDSKRTELPSDTTLRVIEQSTSGTNPLVVRYLLSDTTGTPFCTHMFFLRSAKDPFSFLISRSYSRCQSSFLQALQKFSFPTQLASGIHFSLSPGKHMNVCRVTPKFTLLIRKPKEIFTTSSRSMSWWRRNGALTDWST